MRQVTNDRRTRRTKKAIEQAFTELILKNDINKITIQDITDKADTNRSTFYTHYEDIYDILRVTEDKLIDGISIFHSDNLLGSDAQKSMTESLQYVLDNREIFKAIINSSHGTEFLGKLCGVIGSKLLALLDNVPENEMLVCLYTNGAIAVIKEWLSSDSPVMTADEMCVFLENTIRRGIDANKKE
ncbi:MAG: TetR-like C-terminal domain-containing protein [bacterium]|nr:TetR-like C-terminal domain-containing protein [bacterium]